MIIKGWEGLKFFSSGEWQVCDERLHDCRKTARPGTDGFNPGRKSLFSALQATPAATCRVAIIGQDPYPQAEYATGLAFSIPSKVPAGEWPPTLRTVFAEYQSDLHYPCPSNGDLTPWAKQGVLLWNAVPSCKTGHSLSQDWSEWEYLTREIIRTLSAIGVVYALLGQVARRYLSDIDLTNNSVILTSHPSPRGSRSSHTPFVGSRLFSSINDKLTDMGREPIDWRLP